MKLIYWATTLFLSIFLLWSAYSYLFNKNTIDGISALGFPDYFRIQLAILKFMATLIILIPWTPLYVKEWAYVGIGLFLLTAVVAHTVHRDPIVLNIINIVLIFLTITSRHFLHEIT